MLAGVGGGLQRGRSVVGERLTVAEAGGCGAGASQSAEQRGGLGAAGVEDAAGDRPVRVAPRRRR
jgi:hypothetical protein